MTDVLFVNYTDEEKYQLVYSVAVLIVLLLLLYHLFVRDRPTSCPRHKKYERFLSKGTYGGVPVTIYDKEDLPNRNERVHSGIYLRNSKMYWKDLQDTMPYVQNV